jgi:hypothetical protein
MTENGTKKTKKDYMDKFYKNHPELLTTDIICDECGQPYKYNTKSNHYKSKKHNMIIDALNNQNLKKVNH